MSDNKKAQHWADIEERGSYLGMRILMWLYRHAGRGLIAIILYPVVAYFFITSKQARIESRRFLMRVKQTANRRGLTSAIPDVVSAGWIYRHFFAFAESTFARILAWVGHIPHREVIFEQREQLLGYLARGQGVVLLGSHLGNLELCRGVMSHVYNQANTTKPKVKMNILVLTRHAAKITTLIKKLNPSVDLELIQVDSVGPETAIYLQQKIALGECVVVLADRLSPLPNSRATSANFLGAPARFPQGPFVLAALLKCPVFFMGCVKREGRHHVYLDHYTDYLKLARKNREQDLQKIVDAYAASLEQHCLEAPLQWFNFYDFWEADGNTQAAPATLKASN